MKQTRSKHNVVRKKNKLFARLCVIIIALFILTTLFLFAKRVYKINTADEPNLKMLFNFWNDKDYEKVYSISNSLIERNPLNIRALTFHGYSSFFLALAQTDMALTQNYLDETINCLRISMMSVSKSNLPQLYYMLGKAYFYKNVISNFHYYADLTIKYLLLAIQNDYKSSDIPECLGLSYAQLGITDKSIENFTDALLIRESDELLLAIAQQYYNCKKSNTAMQYLNKINQESSNELLVLKSRILLAQIYLDEEKYDDALKEFQSILEKDANSADAYYGIGVIYEKRGDNAKARAEWRKALKVQVNHPGALNKMGK